MKIHRNEVSMNGSSSAVEKSSTENGDEAERKWEKVVFQKLLTTLEPLLPKSSLNDPDIGIDVLCAVRGLILEADKLRNQVNELQKTQSCTKRASSASQNGARALMSHYNQDSWHVHRLDDEYLCFRHKIGSSVERSSPDETAPHSRATYDAVLIEVGDIVEGNHRNRGTWKAGKITRQNADYTFTVDYDDGEVETYMTAGMLRYVKSTVPKLGAADCLAVGTKVEGNYRGKGLWYPGVVSRVIIDQKYNVDYDDGEKEVGVAKELVRRPVHPPNSSQFRICPRAPSSAALAEGCRVEGNYRGKGRWYPGRISKVNRDGSLNIDYDDGEKEQFLAEDMIRLVGGGGRGIARSPPRTERLEEGSKVEGNYRGKGRWYPGRISRVNADGSFNVDYDDGEKETRLDASLVRAVGGAAAATPGRMSHSPVRGAAFRLEEGAKVEGNYRGVGKWYPGRISMVNRDGTFNIDYDDGEKEKFLAENMIRLVERGVTTEFTMGTKVEGKYHDRGTWYPGRIVGVNADGTFDIDFDDGVTWKKVPARRIRRRFSQPPVPVGGLVVGARVEGSYLGRGCWLPGCISRLNADGSYNVDFDNGEKEEFLSASWVRLKVSEGDKVEGNYGGMGKWYSGRVTRVHADGSIDIEYDDGEKEFRLSSSLVRATATTVEGTALSALAVGTKVEGNYHRDATWRPAQLSRVNLDGTFNLDYDDGEKETRLERSCIRVVGEETAGAAGASGAGGAECEIVSAKAAAVVQTSTPVPIAPPPDSASSPKAELSVQRWVEGALVSCYIPRTSRTFFGRIAKVLDLDKFDVAYHDGGVELAVPKAQLSLVGPPQSATVPAPRTGGLSVGAQVQENYRGEGRWYPATVSRVHLDGTYDIEYLDVKENHVDEGRVRLVATPAPLLRIAGNYDRDGKWVPNLEK